MAVRSLEENEKLSLELVTFAKKEIERRQKAPVFVSGEEVEAQLKTYNHALIFDVRIGANQKSFRFWKNRTASKQRNAEWKELGHRHTVEAVIYYAEGEGYSVIDGKTYPWKPGDFVCVPMFAWHRHHVTSGERMSHLAATTGPLSMYLGLAIYEDERYPEHWILAQKGDEEMRTLIPNKSGVPEGSTKVVLGGGQHRARSKTDELYSRTLGFAEKEEQSRRAGRVLVRGDELVFEPSRMGNIALVVDPALGFHVRTLGTLVAEIPPGKRSGAHRHVYEETNYVLSGQGYSIIEDRRYEWKKGDSLCIPLFGWHQHFNTGNEPARFLVHHDRPYMENLGFLMVQHGEDANY
jgi:gentisate 1,2-dioxygenase